MDVISDLKSGDTNALLWVGEGPAPTPAPTPAPPENSWVVTGTGCREAGNCIASTNHPGNYGNNEACSIRAYKVDITVRAFNTEDWLRCLDHGWQRLLWFWKLQHPPE